jgi:hypothetical protein
MWNLQRRLRGHRAYHGTGDTGVTDERLHREAGHMSRDHVDVGVLLRPVHKGLRPFQAPASSYPTEDEPACVRGRLDQLAP